LIHQFISASQVLEYGLQVVFDLSLGEGFQGLLSILCKEWLSQLTKLSHINVIFVTKLCNGHKLVMELLVILGEIGNELHHLQSLGFFQSCCVALLEA
jgi:hypothetical protein